MNPINDWSKRYYILGAGNDRGGPVDFESSAPQCMKVLADRLDPEIKTQTVNKSNQSSGTIMGEAISAFTLDRRPGNMAINCQSDEDAIKFAKTRFVPRIKKIPGIAAALPNAKHGINQDRIFFPDGTFLYIQGPGENNAQSFTASAVWNDEPYLYAPGRILEFANRVGRAWNGKVLNTSVGADGPGTDVDKLYQEGTQEEWCHRCLDCHQLYLPTWWKTRYDKYVIQWDRSMEEGEKTNYDLLGGTVRIVCPHCGERHPDTRPVRKELTSFQRAAYVPANPKGNKRRPSYRWNKLTPWEYSVAELVEKFLKAIQAKRTGNYAPIKKFVQMEMAETYNRMDHESFGAELTVPSGDYSLADVETEDFRRRFPLRISGWDRQGGAIRRREGVCRAFGRMEDGSFGSRLVWTGIVDDKVQMRQKQLELGVRDALTAQDCAFESDEVYSECREYKWIAMIGSVRENWEHPPSGRHQTRTIRPYSPSQWERGAWRVSWSNPRIKETVLAKRTQQGLKDEAGKPRVEYWGLPRDCPDAYLIQINQRPILKPDGCYEWSEGNDHRHDCECMIEAIWQMYLDGMYPHAPKL